MNSEDKTGPLSIERLQVAGVAATDIKKLRDAGIFTIEALVRTPRKDLITSVGFTEIKLDRMLKEASQLIPMGFRPASLVLKQTHELIRITTGCKALDELLDGGIESESITELHGEYRCGKTQLCHTLAVTCQLPISAGGGEGRCLYIDTEGSFRPQRLVAIASRFGLSPNDTLENVAYARAHNTDHQTQLLVAAAGVMSESRFSLIVVDSATGLYRSEFNGRGELNARQNHMGRFLRALRKLGDEFGVALVVTNQVVANFDNSPVFTASTVKPIGGNIMSHAATTRLSMSKGKGNTRKVRVVASPCLPDRTTEILIGDNGIQDIPIEVRK